MFKSLLIAIDGSELGDKALAAGAELAKAHGSKILMLTATDPVATGIGAGGFGTFDAGPIIVQLEDDYAAQAKKLLDAARQKLDASGIASETLHVPRHRPADAILEAVASHGIDTIVMGSHGRRGLGRLLLGSQASEVLARSSVPVLIVK
jgi:nucleotide-binding universal stress UspA family protein